MRRRNGVYFMENHLEKLRVHITPLRRQIVEHQLYREIKTIEDLRVFMSHHVYAVWDFMSLLKSLQRGLTCTTIPWVPVGSAETRFLINEIVCGEESDVDAEGRRMSHFELYRNAMRQCGAAFSEIDSFVSAIVSGDTIEQAFEKANTSAGARAFVRGTFDVVHSGEVFLQAAVFTFGREDLIPDMFLSMVNDIYSRVPESISIFKYYLERHIEVDGDHHSHLALQMTSELCGDDSLRWKAAEAAVVRSLQQRIELWDAALEAILHSRQ